MVSAIDANSVKESGDHDTCSDVVTVNNVVKLITSIRFLPQCHSCCKSELKQISDSQLYNTQYFTYPLWSSPHINFYLNSTCPHLTMHRSHTICRSNAYSCLLLRVDKICTRTPIFLKQVSSWYLLFDPHLISHQSDKNV